MNGKQDFMCTATKGDSRPQSFEIKALALLLLLIRELPFIHYNHMFHSLSIIFILHAASFIVVSYLTFIFFGNLSLFSRIYFLLPMDILHMIFSFFENFASEFAFTRLIIIYAIFEKLIVQLVMVYDGTN